METEPQQETIAVWQRWFAVECNNRAWKLTTEPQRSADEDREMLDAAHAASFHWGKIGTDVNRARADVTLAHVHALLGNGAQALAYAQACLVFFEAGNGEDWDLAFAHLEMALAAATLGDAALHAAHYSAAQQLGAAIEDAEDRQVFLAELARIPDRVASAD